MISLDLSNHIKINFNKWQSLVDSIHEQIETLKCSENNFLGWIDYIEKEQAYISNIIALGKSLKHYKLMVVIGIGGSFLGAKSAYELLKNRNCKKGCELLFIGTELSGYNLKTTLAFIKKKDFCVNVISKSGDTLETAITFRFIKALLNEKYGKKANERIFITTNSNRSALKCFANERGLNFIEIPENIGGRYSLFTAVSLLPLTASGINTEEIIEGFKNGKKTYEKSLLKDNIAYQYAVARRVANINLKEVEIFTAYEANMSFYLEWLKQLFGESEGKKHKGIYPISVINTRDLHSLGQFFQEGTQKHFETIIFIEEDIGLKVPNCDSNFDGLNYLTGVTIDKLNQTAMEGTRNAHNKGGIPNILIKTKGMNSRIFGQLSYFFMRSCIMTCYLLGVNPFNQPGVEQYKKEIKKILKTL